MNNIIFNQDALDGIICSVMGVNKAAFQSAKAAGRKPVKAAIKLGAEGRTAQLVADLKLATTAEEIDGVYAGPIKSCMQGRPVGKFYEYNGIGVVYGPDFRTLVGLTAGVWCTSHYGTKGGAIMARLVGHIDIVGYIPAKREVIVQPPSRLVLGWKEEAYVLQFKLYHAISPDSVRVTNSAEIPPEVRLPAANRAAEVLVGTSATIVNGTVQVELTGWDIILEVNVHDYKETPLLASPEALPTPVTREGILFTLKRVRQTTRHEAAGEPRVHMAHQTGVPNKCPCVPLLDFPEEEITWEGQSYRGVTDLERFHDAWGDE